MKKKLLIPALALFATASLVSCSKKDDDQSKTELLTKAGWKVVSVQMAAGGSAYANIPVDDCQKDDVTLFTSDHKYTYSVNTQCDPSDDNYDGIWLFSDDEKKLIVDGEELNIATLNDNSLVIETQEEDNGITFKYRSTFGH